MSTRSVPSRAAYHALTGGLLLAGPASAHHSFALFQMQDTYTVTGTVKDYQWTNPHIWIDLVIVDPDTKQPLPWPVEGGSISIQEKQGWTRDSIKVGDTVTLVVHRLKRSDVRGGSLVSGSVNGKQIGHAYDFNAPGGH